MTYRKWINLCTLLAFLPLAVGCSGTRTLMVKDDPADSEVGARYQAGEPVDISGYTRPDDGFREWSGYVQTIPPDSLLFTPKREYKQDEAAATFRLAKSDVVSLAAREYSSGKTMGLVFALIAIGGIIALAIIGHQISQMDLSVQI
jgi:hypothetical protein